MDPQIYHLPIAKWLVAEGGYRYHPYQTAWAYPHNISNLFAVTQLLDDDPFFRTAQLTHAALGVLWLTSVYALGKVLFGRAAGLAAGVLCVGIQGVPWEFSGAVVDLGFAFFAGTAFLAFVQALTAEEGRQARWLVLAALLAGAAAVCKVHGPAVAVALALAAGLWQARRGWRAGLGWFGAVGLVSFAVASPMYLKNWLLYYDPVYPFTTLFPNRDFPEAVQRCWFLDQREEDRRLMFEGPYPAWQWPYAWLLGEFMEASSPGPGVLAGLLLLPVLGREWLRRHWPLLLAVGVVAALWWLIGPLTRFAYPWAAVLLVVACAPLSRPALRRPGVLVPAALLLCAAPVIALQAEGLMPPWSHVVLRQSNERYLRWAEPGTGTLTPALFDAIGQLNEEYRRRPWQGRVLIDAVHIAYADFRTVPAQTYLWNRAAGWGEYARLPGASGPGTLDQYTTRLSDRELLEDLTQRLQVRHVLAVGPAAAAAAGPERRLDVILEGWARAGLVRRRPLGGTVLYTFDDERVRAALRAPARQARVGPPGPAALPLPAPRAGAPESVRPRPTFTHAGGRAGRCVATPGPVAPGKGPSAREDGHGSG
jgi:hypothetical protein